MLPRSQRLTLRQFDAVMRKGMVQNSPFFLVRTLKNQDSARFAAVTPHKLSKRAVERNRIRRDIYRALGSIDISHTIPAHTIVFAKPPTIGATHEEMIAHLTALFVKMGLLR